MNLCLLSLRVFSSINTSYSCHAPNIICLNIFFLDREIRSKLQIATFMLIYVSLDAELTNLIIKNKIKNKKAHPNDKKNDIKEKLMILVKYATSPTGPICHDS